MREKQSIFYSWQSDTPGESNRYAINESLKYSAVEIESEIDNFSIDVDQATRDVSGSPNIPITILEKIGRCDIFVADITTINSGTIIPEFRKVPNPNVLIELGYAVATVGWSRIILIFNDTFGKFPDDVPFDVDRHRITRFKINGKNDKSGKKQLTTALKRNIKLILQENPKKPSELKDFDPIQKRKDVDVTNLRWIMSTIHLKSFDNFLERSPQIIINDIYHYWESFCAVHESSSFHLYDEKLKLKLSSFKEKWKISLSFPQHYHIGINGKQFNYHIPLDIFPNDQSERDFKKLTKNRGELSAAFQDLLKLIRNEYIEIDVDATSHAALQDFKGAI